MKALLAASLILALVASSACSSSPETLTATLLVTTSTVTEVPTNTSTISPTETDTPIVPIATGTPTATSTPIPTDTATPTSVPISTATSTETVGPTETPTAMVEDIPLEVLEPALQAYGIMIIMQGNLNLLHEAAVRIQAGTLEGFESLGAIIAISALVGAVEEAKLDVAPPQDMVRPWEHALEVHEATIILLGDWFNDEITSAEVIPQTGDLIPQLEAIVQEAERILAKEYDADPSELTAARQEALAAFDEVWETLGGTPTPEA